MVVILGASGLASRFDGRVAGYRPQGAGFDSSTGVPQRAYLSMKGPDHVRGDSASRVLVDLMVAVGVGVFVANFLDDRADGTPWNRRGKAISTGDGDTDSYRWQKSGCWIRRRARCLSSSNGGMIFGCGQGISRETTPSQLRFRHL